MRDRDRTILRRLLPRVFMGLLLASVVVGATLDPTLAAFPRLRALVEHDLFVLLLIALYLVRPVTLFPLGGLHVVAGFVYGGVLGTAVALTGTLLTCIAPFALGRYAPPTSGVAGWVTRTGRSAFTATGDLRGMIAASLSPVPADAVAYAAGASEVPWPVFLLGTIVGEVPWVVAYVLVGTSAASLSASMATDVVGLVVLLSVLAALVVARPLLGAVRDGEGAGR